MNIRVLLFFILICEIPSFAQSVHKDPIDKYDYKLKKEEFIKKYGTNDTSVAIIEFYYKKRKNGLIKICLIPAPWILGITAMIIDQAIQSGSDMIIPYVFMPTYIITVSVVVPLVATGIFQEIRYSRKHLYFIIRDYSEKGTIPDWLKKKMERSEKR